MDSIYIEEILEHYNKPFNFGKIKSFTYSSKLKNPFCGDEIEIFIKLTRLAEIEEIGFLGEGCAISIAAGSMLTEYAKGKTRQELTNFKEKDMLELLGIEVSETRKKCALLGWAVLKDCLINV